MESSSGPLVSVLTTNYNGLEFLPETVESVLKQTFKNFEYIVVDDGSDDGSVEYLKSIKDPRVKLVLLPRSGRGKGLNEGLKYARGKYVAILDADDVAPSYRLDAQVRKIEKEKNCDVLAGLLLFL